MTRSLKTISPNLRNSRNLNALLMAAALRIAAPVQPALADVITSFSVGPDQALIYPSDLPTLPDQHVTFFPPPPDSSSYLVFASSNILGGPAGTVALETSDLKNFSYASGTPTRSWCRRSTS
jgi:hypothetical protein